MQKYKKKKNTKGGKQQKRVSLPQIGSIADEKLHGQNLTGDDIGGVEIKREEK